MTKRELLEALKDVPDDAVVRLYDLAASCPVRIECVSLDGENGGLCFWPLFTPDDLDY